MKIWQANLLCWPESLRFLRVLTTENQRGQLPSSKWRFSPALLALAVPILAAPVLESPRLLVKILTLSFV